MKNKVVIFGAWQEGIDLFFAIQNMVDVVAFIDNNPQIRSKEIYGIKIVSPNDLKEIEYDEIFISSSRQYRKMQVQLLELGVEKTRVRILFSPEKIRADLKIYFNYLEQTIDSFETRWRELKNQYRKICLYMLDVSCIGETVVRLCIMAEDELSTDQSVLRVFIPSVGQRKRICNLELVKLVQERLNIVNEQNYKFWEYVLEEHGDEVDILDYNKYLQRGDISNRMIMSDYVLVSFRQSQIELGKKKMSLMGLKGKYVCMAARSSAYAQNSFKDKSLMEYNIVAHKYRNSDFGEYKKTIDYLKTMNIQAVRMGRGENPIDDMDNCIDYAGLYADDFMDIFLMANCEFAVVGGGSGIYTLATAYGRPVLFVNTVLLTLGNGGEYYSENDMYIPKKVFSESKGRYLSLLEIADIENICFANGVMYNSYGIVFIDNSSEEILDATKEMINRINGQWEDTEEDIRINQCYENIIKAVNKESSDNIYNWMGGAMPRRLSVSYMKKNMYLLDDRNI